MFCFDFNQRPQYSFQIPLIANRLSSHKNTFDFGFQQKNRFLNALWSYRNFYKFLCILFGYFRGLKLKQEKKKTEKEKGIAKKKVSAAGPNWAESGPAGQPPRARSAPCGGNCSVAHARYGVPFR
jgi:hypothetical protein